MIKTAKEKLETALKEMGSNNTETSRELERLRMEKVVGERELGEAKRVREELAREIKELRDTQIKEAKRAYEDPAEVRVRELTKELSKAKDNEY